MGELRVRGRDASARLGVLQTAGRPLRTPAFFPVFNPNKPYVTPREMREDFGFGQLIANSYILCRNPHLKEEALEKGLHSMFDFDGVIMTDSGAYQLFKYGEVEVSNREIIEFQREIGADIGTIIDFPMSSKLSYPKAKEGTEITIRNAEEWAEMREEIQGTAWLGTVQGSVYEDLVESCGSRIASLGFDYFGAGSIKVALERYDYRAQVEYFLRVRRALPPNRPIHFWGIGHPATFAFFTALGADSFDSAAYAIFAVDGRYMTVGGTLRLQELEEFPCNCPICMGHTPKEVRALPEEERVRVMSKHNLYACAAEMRRVREAIRGGWLWELVQMRARYHPKLLEGLRRAFSSFKEELELREPFSKKSGIFYSGEETRLRPEVLRSKELLARVTEGERFFHSSLFGRVPIGLRYTYPFGQTHVPGEEETDEKPSDEELVRQILQYQFGSEASGSFARIRLARSRATGMPRDVYDGEVRVGMVRSHDGLFVPGLEGAKRLLRAIPPPGSRVVVKDERRELVARGGTVFSDFVSSSDPRIRPQQEVLVVDDGDSLLATGKSFLSSQEVGFFEHHPFVGIRHHVLSSAQGD